jgi:hypothetical protein
MCTCYFSFLVLSDIICHFLKNVTHCIHKQLRESFSVYVLHLMLQLLHLYIYSLYSVIFSYFFYEFK